MFAKSEMAHPLSPGSCYSRIVDGIFVKNYTGVSPGNSVCCCKNLRLHFVRVIPPPPSSRMSYFRMIILYSSIYVQDIIINVLFPELFSMPAFAHIHVLHAYS